MDDGTKSDDAVPKGMSPEVAFNVNEFFYPDERERQIRQWWQGQDENDRLEFIRDTNESVHLSLRIAEVMSAVVETTRLTAIRSEDNAVTHVAASKALRRVLPRAIKNLQMLSAALAAQQQTKNDPEPAPVEDWPGMYL